MKKAHLILIAVIVIIFIFLAATINSPILVVAEDNEEDASIDMAAAFSLKGFEWIYPGSSYNSYGQTLHNVHMDYPDNPYAGMKEIMEYTYKVSPFLIISVNNEAAQAIFGEHIVDDIRANDAYNGYAGNEKMPGTMSRGDSMMTAMITNGVNVPMIPIQILLGNISFHFI